VRPGQRVECGPLVLRVDEVIRRQWHLPPPIGDGETWEVAATQIQPKPVRPLPPIIYRAEDVAHWEPA